MEKVYRAADSSDEKKDLLHKKFRQQIFIENIAIVAMCTFFAGTMVYIGKTIINERINPQSPPGIEENIPINYKYTTLENGEEIRYLNRKTKQIYTCEVILANNDKNPKQIEEANIRWTPAENFTELFSNDSERIIISPTDEDYEGFRVFDVKIKDWNPSDSIVLSAIYDEKIMTENPMAEKQFFLRDGSEFDQDKFISNFINRHPNGTEAGLNDLKEIARSAESIMDIFKAVRNINIEYIDKEIDESVCVRTAALVKFLLIEYDPRLEPKIIHCIVENDEGETASHVDVQIKTMDGYIKIDPNISAKNGYFTAHGINAPLDNGILYNKKIIIIEDVKNHVASIENDIIG